MLGPIQKQAPAHPSFAYDFDTLKLILKLAEYYIRADTKNIFIQTANETALCYLQEAITTFKQPLNQEIHQLCENFQVHLQATVIAAKLSSESSYDNSDSLNIDLNRLKIDDVTEIEWSVLVKLAIQNSAFLNRDSISAHAAWLVLMKQLRNIYVHYKNEMEKKDNDVSLFELKGGVSTEVMQQFIGQLAQLEKIESAFILHQYLRILKLAYENNEMNDLDEEKLGLILAATLGDSLNISPHLHIDEYLVAEPGMSEAVIKEKSVKTFLKFLFKNMLNSSFFKKNFTPELYTNYHQDEWQSTYNGIMTKITVDELRPPAPEKNRLDLQENEQELPKLRDIKNDKGKTRRRFSLRGKIKGVPRAAKEQSRVVSCMYSQVPVTHLYDRQNSVVGASGLHLGSLKSEEVKKMCKK